MAVGHLISAEEYLHTSFEHDAEYVEGRIVYRSMPKLPHSIMQGFLVYRLYQMAARLGIVALPEQRVRTQKKPDRYRVPDVCVTFGMPQDEVLTSPPFLCIEIISPDDTVSEMREKIREYLDFGVEYVWVVDPVKKNGEIHTRDSILAVRDGRFRAGEIEIDVTEVAA